MECWPQHYKIISITLLKRDLANQFWIFYHRLFERNLKKTPFHLMNFSAEWETFVGIVQIMEMILRFHFMQITTIGMIGLSVGQIVTAKKKKINAQSDFWSKRMAKYSHYILQIGIMKSNHQLISQDWMQLKNSYTNCTHLESPSLYQMISSMVNLSLRIAVILPKNTTKKYYAKNKILSSVNSLSWDQIGVRGEKHCNWKNKDCRVICGFWRQFCLSIMIGTIQSRWAKLTQDPFNILWLCETVHWAVYIVKW